METIYRINANELSEELIKSIQAAFNGKEIEIKVTDQLDETDYLLSTKSNKEHLYKSMEELERGDGVPMTLAELQEKYLK
jgi:uncharacterized protein YutD